MTGGELFPDTLPRVTVAGRSLDGPALAEAARAVAARVEGAGRVAVDASPVLETVVAVLGCLLAGTPAVPVPPDSGPRERDHLVRDSQAALWLGGAEAGDIAIPFVPVDVAARAPSDWTPTAPAATDPALVVYTSGTTGAPKGAVLSRRAVAAGIDGLRDAWEWGPHDTLVHGRPLFHVHGLVLGVLGALRAGSPLVHTGRPTPSAYAAAGGSLYFGVPTVWGRVAAAPDAARALRGARLLVSGSAGLPAGVFRDLAALAGQGPVERYGMTETLITLATRVDGSRSPGRVGVPIAGVSARIVDDAGVPVGTDEIGTLHVRGATLFDGYLGRGPAPVDGDGWFDTGDAAAVDASGDHRIVGRVRDDLISSGGYRVGAGEIEAALLDHPSVTEAAVVGVPDDDLGQRIVAFVVGSGVDTDGLIEHVARELSRHKRPREVRVVDALPRNAMGKIQKVVLRSE